MKEEAKKKFLLDLAFAVAAVGLAVFLIRYVLRWVLPFVVGLAVAALLRPTIRRLQKTTRLPARLVSAAVVCLFYALLVLLAWFFIVFCAGQISSLAQALPGMYRDDLEPALKEMGESISRMLTTLSPQMEDLLSQAGTAALDSLSAAAASLSASAISWLTGFAGKVPRYLMAILFSVLCSVFISTDYERVTGFLLRQLPPKGQHVLGEAKRFLSGTLLKMLGAYGIILIMTFTELAVGLTVLGVEYAVTMAAIIAFLDILPAIGSGLVLIPWGISRFLVRDASLGVGLLILYVIITVIRNVMEPRIVGHQIGMHPVLTITAMYAGLRLAGFAGFIMAPVLLLLLRFLNDSGWIHLYK